MDHVIIGAGPAGVIAAETLRKADPDARITIVGNEPEPPYSRMAIPYLLGSQIDEAGTYLRKRNGHYRDRRIELVRDEVQSIARDARRVRLRNGAELGYDKLLIATGASPVSLDIPGIALAGVHPCWTLEDAREIARLARPGAKVTLIGAGFIGCIIMEALLKRGVELTVVEMGNRMVPRMMNDTAGNLIRKWCENKGVTVHTSTQVEAVEKPNGNRTFDVQLKGDGVVYADLVVPAVGVRSNTGFLDGSGITVDEGILVDDRLQTDDPDIHAAGDVAQGKDFGTGGYSVQAVQPTAADHARIAAMNMAGRHTPHRGSVNMNVLDTVGLISSSFGQWMGVDGGDTAELSDPDRFRYLNLQFQEDVLVGASGLGLTEHVGVVRGLIQSRVRLGAWKNKLKADPTRLMEAYVGCTQAIGHNAGVLL